MTRGDNVKAKTVEHYFQASKFLESNAQLAQAVLDTPTPREARDLAHANKTAMTPQWYTAIDWERRQQLARPARHG